MTLWMHEGEPVAAHARLSLDDGETFELHTNDVPLLRGRDTVERQYAPYA